MAKKFSERDILLMTEVSKGRTYKEVARIMRISPRTVEWHIQRIFSHTGCKNKVEMVNYFRENIALRQPPAKKLTGWLSRTFGRLVR